MPHLVNPIACQSISKVITDLHIAHSFLVKCASEAIQHLSVDIQYWGVSAKRLHVQLNKAGKPQLIDKPSESLTEIINITATMERLVDTLEWFEGDTQYNRLSVLVCHPSTSDNVEGNDIVLIDDAGRVRVRCEVCDVASSKAGQNGKEKKDIQNLGINNEVPADGIDRFIATSEEFAYALVSPCRKWEGKLYRYELIKTRNTNKTCLLRVIGNDQS